jgi:Zn2+/Cd2+-exporting ATPase
VSTSSPLVFDVAGMDCGDCAQTVQRVVSATPGVQSAAVNFAVGTLVVTPNGVAIDDLSLAIAHNVDRAGYQAHLRQDGVRGDLQRLAWYRNSAVQHAAIAVVIWLAAFTVGQISGRNTIAIPLYIAAIVLGGYPIARSALQAVRVRRVDMNLLMTVSVIGAMTIGEWVEGGLIVVLFSIGTALQAITFDLTRNSIRSLFELAPEEATLVQNEQEMRVRAASLDIGDVVRIRPGERAPVDGQIVSGYSTFNESAITGESMPLDKAVGESVFAGGLNGSGVVDVRTMALPQDSTIATIIRLVEEASATRAPSQQLVDRFAAMYTPIVVALAVVIAVAGWIFGDGPTWFYRALVLLVIACPCALVISTPVSIVSAIGNATRLGMLVKGGAALEEAGRITIIAFDKTGTLTLGRPAVTGIHTVDGIDETELVTLAAAVERNSEHPLARAIIARATRMNVDMQPVTDFEAVTSAGTLANVNGRRIGVGNERLLIQLGISPRDVDQFTEANQLSSAIFVAEEGRLLGAIVIADQQRQSAPEVIAKLREHGIEKVVMLTGDRRSVAERIASSAGVDEVRAELLPQEKSQAITAYQQSGERIMVVGDGINDAPALAVANVGVAMGMAGTDIALESADMALMRDDLTVLPRVISLSRRTVHIIRQNITLSLITKVAALGLGVFGFVSLWIAVVVDVGTSVIVTLNGMRLARNRED